MLSDSDVPDYYERFLKEKELVEHATERLNNAKAALMEYAEANGIVDDAGHQWVTLDNGLTFKRELRRPAPVLNTDKVREWCEDVGRTDEVFVEKTIVVLDEDALLAAAEDEELSDERIDSFYDQPDPKYAFIPGKAR